MSEANIAVVTEGHRKIEHNYNVTYKNATDPFLGNITRPVAEEIKAKIDAKIDAELEAKIDAKIDAKTQAKIEADLADIKSIKICIAPEQKMM